MGSATRTGDTLGHFEPFVTTQLLRGCACGTPHPITLRAINTTACPKCGAPSAPPGAVRTERALLTGWSIGATFLAIGATLTKLARNLRS